MYLEYFNPIYLFELLFWIITFLLLKKFWYKNKVRLVYGYLTAALNLLAAGLYIYISTIGALKVLDAIAYSFLHTIVSIVMITLHYISKQQKSLIDGPKQTLN